MELLLHAKCQCYNLFIYIFFFREFIDTVTIEYAIRMYISSIPRHGHIIHTYKHQKLFPNLMISTRKNISDHIKLFNNNYDDESRWAEN